MCKLVLEQTKETSKKTSSFVDKFNPEFLRRSIESRHKPLSHLKLNKKGPFKIYSENQKKFDYNIVENNKHKIVYKKYVNIGWEARARGSD